ncbi:MAG: hypothetical protein R3344_04680 [Acidobacteriota bacterium]|nr:hypothetical protein [Acidobacteriota bacterium]
MYVLRAGATLSPEKANEYAARNDIDVPLAGSVLLGIVSPDKAQEITDARKHAAEESISQALDAVLRFADEADRPAQAEAETPRPAAAETPPLPGPAPEASPPDDSDEVPYDRGFRAAVAAGHLTVPEAMQRGDREALIKRLRERYELTRSLAAKVADNEMNLRAAMVAATAAPVDEQLPAASPTVRRDGGSWWTVALAVAVLLVAGWGLTHRLAPSKPSSGPPVVDPEPPPAPQEAITERLLAATRVRTNETGELVEIAGPDPTSVLRMFCERSPLGKEIEPVRIASSVPASANTRRGIYRKLDAPETLFSITIRRDRKSSRWVVGDGNSPIPTIERPAN